MKSRLEKLSDNLQVTGAVLLWIGPAIAVLTCAIVFFPKLTLAAAIIAAEK